MFKASIVIDFERFNILHRHLVLSGYAFMVTSGTMQGTALIHVMSENMDALNGVIETAMAEANWQGVIH